MATIKAKKIPQKKISNDDLLAKFCYHYQQYKYSEAKKLPYKRVIKMLRVAEKEQARFLFELTQIATAPHTKKGAGVKSLLDRYKSMID